MPHSSVDHTLAVLQKQAPNSSFLALGQTVFWDEPVKAVWRRILDRQWPSAHLIAGIHDTDYFAKTTAHIADDHEFIALGHDDGATRGLWSAAGELSALLGSEDVPTRSFFESVGVPFDRLAGRNATERREFFADHTLAYGWRGVVQTYGTPLIAHDVTLNRFGEALMELLDWGFAESLGNLDESTAAKGKLIVSTIRNWVADYLANCPDESTLSDLGQELLPKFYELLLDSPPANFSVTSTANLLRFNTQTANLPRFAFVQIFLDPKTRKTAIDAYSKAVAGGGMYALDHFGEDALPFDIVVPGTGRGTLHIGPGSVQVDFAPSPIIIKTGQDTTNVVDLAALLAERFGENVVLVGKAVSLISMLAAEFTVVFHETASGYTDRTAAMNNSLRAQGIPLKLNPIVRLQYSTWDSLSDVTGSRFKLPAHLAETFKVPKGAIDVSEFGKRWRSVVSVQRSVLKDIQGYRSLRSLLDYLATNGNAVHWQEQKKSHDKAVARIKDNRVQTLEIHEAIADIRLQIKDVKNQRKALEARSGNDYRQRLRPLQQALLGNDTGAKAQIAAVEQNRATEFREPIALLAITQRKLRKALRLLAEAKKVADRMPVVLTAQQEIEGITDEANLAKLAIARNAYLTVEGLTHLNSRPTSWWIPMVDQSGTWFDNITGSVQARLEEI
jgi:hypothetical protein